MSKKIAVSFLFAFVFFSLINQSEAATLGQSCVRTPSDSCTGNNQYCTVSNNTCVCDSGWDDCFSDSTRCGCYTYDGKMECMRNLTGTVESCSDRLGGGSTPAPTPTKPPAPATLTATCDTNGTASISWSAVTGASKYHLRIDDLIDGWDPYNLSTNDHIVNNLTLTSYSHTGPVGRTYNIWVHSQVGTVVSDPISTSVSCVPVLACTGTAPNGSSTIMCTGDNTSLTSTLAWSNVGTTSSSCTSTRKCEYYTPATIYSCTGTAPNGSTQIMCSGDSTVDATNYTSWSNVGTTSASCTSTRKCEYYTPTSTPTPPPSCGGSPTTTHAVTATGATSGGTVWGSGPYTTDSNINVASVHAGLLTVGQTGTINITSAGCVSSFVGSTRNGITTSSYSNYYGMNISLGAITTSIPTPPPCTPDCSSAPYYCTGTTFSDGCTGICYGSKVCATPTPPTCNCVNSTSCGAYGSALYQERCDVGVFAGWMVSGCQWITCGPPPPPPPTLTLTASPTTIASGANSTLTWNISGGTPTQCTASGDWSGSKTIYSNSQMVTPTNSTDLDIIKTYRLECTNAGGSSGIQTATVRVNPVPNIPPTANITYPIANQTIDIGSPINFTGTGTDTDGTINRYRWWLNSCDGARLKVGPDATFLDYQFNEVGTFNIFFQVRDDDNAWSTCDSRTITVNSISTPTPTPTPTPVPVCIGTLPSSNMELCDKINGTSGLTANTPNTFMFSCPASSVNKCRYTCKGTSSPTPTATPCSPITWSPDPATVCSGTSFTQTSNCTTTRLATGTKNCTTPTPIPTPISHFKKWCVDGDSDGTDELYWYNSFNVIEEMIDDCIPRYGLACGSYGSKDINDNIIDIVPKCCPIGQVSINGWCVPLVEIGGHCYASYQCRSQNCPSGVCVP